MQGGRETRLPCSFEPYAIEVILYICRIKLFFINLLPNPLVNNHVPIILILSRVSLNSRAFPRGWVQILWHFMVRGVIG